jgi:hypothetical protein
MARFRRGGAGTVPEDRVRAPSVERKPLAKTTAERAAAIRRAHARAQAEGIALTQALILEGVIEPKRRY